MCVTHTLRTMSQTIDIKALRKKHSMSQAELAKAAGVNTSTVWRWEKGGIPDRGAARAFLERLAGDAQPGKSVPQ